MREDALSMLRSLVGHKVAAIRPGADPEDLDFDLIFEDGRTLECYFAPSGGWSVGRDVDGDIAPVFRHPPDAATLEDALWAWLDAQGAVVRVEGGEGGHRHAPTREGVHRLRLRVERLLERLRRQAEAAGQENDEEAFIRACRAEYGSPEKLEREIAAHENPGHPEWEHLIEWEAAEDRLRKKGENPGNS